MVKIMQIKTSNGSSLKTDEKKRGLKDFFLSFGSAMSEILNFIKQGWIQEYSMGWDGKHF